MYIFAIIAFEIAVPFCLLWLFEWGLWMVVCQAINIICMLAYISWCSGYIDDSYDGKKKKDTQLSDNEATAVTFGSLMGPLLFAELLLPIWLQGKGFLSRYNFIFNTDYTVTYEGGYISILMTVASGFLFAIIISCTLRFSFSLLASNDKAFIKGFLWAAALYVTLLMAYMRCIGGYDPHLDNRYYKTQMQKEEHEIDRQIESDKNRLIKKAVDDYREQWED